MASATELGETNAIFEKAERRAEAAGRNVSTEVLEGGGGSAPRAARRKTYPIRLSL